jgi:hypothetical protein
VKKSIIEYGDKIGADEKAKIEAALKDAEDLLKQKDRRQGRAEAKSSARAAAAQKLGEIMYAQSQQAAGGGDGGAEVAMAPQAEMAASATRRSSTPSTRKSKTRSDIPSWSLAELSSLRLQHDGISGRIGASPAWATLNPAVRTWGPALGRVDA